MSDAPISTESPVWNWFELTYASYLVLPRSLMCGMPREWQERMVQLLEELRETYDTSAINGNYTVLVRDERGRLVQDPLRNYRRPPPLPYRAGSNP